MFKLVIFKLFLILLLNENLYSQIIGTLPNSGGDTVINQDTIWKEENITLGGDLVVNPGYSFSIDDCKVLFNVTAPKGKMTCGNNTTIIIKDSYIHGINETNRAAGIIFGTTNDTLTIKISSVIFKYIGTSPSWTEKMGGTSTPMIQAKAIYIGDSYFRDCSLICDSKPALPNNSPGNWIWGLEGPGNNANALPARGIKLERCYFYQFYCSIVYQKYIYNCTVIGNSFAVYVPPPYFIIDGCTFIDNPYKPLDFFNGSSYGTISNNYVEDTGIALADIPGSNHNIFANNVFKVIKEGGVGGGNGSNHIFINNEFSTVPGSKRGLFLVGKDYVVAGNTFITGFEFAMACQKYPGGAVPSGNTIFLGNKIENTQGIYAGGAFAGGISIGISEVWQGGSVGWDDVVIAGNEIKNSEPRGIYVYEGTKMVIKKNTIQDCSTGIEITSGSNYYNVSDNIFSGNSTDVKDSSGLSYSEQFPTAQILLPGNNNFVAGETVNFDSSGIAVSTKTIMSYWWFLGDGTISTEQNFTHIFTSSGTWFVALIITDNTGLKDVVLMPGLIEKDTGSFVPLPDTTPPQVLNLQMADIITASATLSWQTSELATSIIKYGNQPGNYNQEISLSNFHFNHSLILTGLQPNTKYYFMIIVRDGSNNFGQSDEFSFTTLAQPETSGNSSIKVSPNPHIKGKSSVEKITFANLPKEAAIRIYTLSGELIKTIKYNGSIDGGSEEWDISDIPSGIYMYCIKSANGDKKGKLSIVK